eukprot:2796327-Amphidinium_carterae.1
MPIGRVRVTSSRWNQVRSKAGFRLHFHSQHLNWDKIKTTSLRRTTYEEGKIIGLDRYPRTRH